MRIINSTKSPAYVMGLSKSLKPLEASRDVALAQLFTDKRLWRQIDAGKLTFKLSDADKALIARVLAEDAKPLPKFEIPEPVHPAVYRQRILDNAQAQAKAKGKAADAAASTPAVNPACVGGTPNFGSVPDQPIPVVMPGQTLSLAQLKHHNQGIAPRLSKGLV